MQDVKYLEDAAIIALDGSVQALGVKTSVEDWLVIGTSKWRDCPDEVKAMSYAAAQAAGWSDTALVNAIRRKYPHLDADMLEFPLQELKELVKKYNIEISGEITMPTVSVVGK